MAHSGLQEGKHIRLQLRSEVARVTWAAHGKRVQSSAAYLIAVRSLPKARGVTSPEATI